MSLRTFRNTSVPKPRRTLDSAAWLKSRHVDVEIGAGAGLHAIHYCKANPDRTLIAIEHTNERFRRLHGRKAHHRLPNLHIVHANAISWIAHSLQAEMIENIFLLYPNPYPKRRQKNRRWHNMPFMGYLLSCLKPGGHLHLATNVVEYAYEAKEAMVNKWQLKCVESQELSQSATPEFTGRTHFERKYLASGQVCYNLKFRRTL